MITKNMVLGLLEKSRGQPVSGQELAEALGVSRAAIWKSVRALEKDGHIIRASTKRGYWLAEENDTLSVQGIEAQLSYISRQEELPRIYVYDSLESTNKKAKELALGGCGHGTVVIANEQTAGRGRRGRSFCSPKGGGLYISFVLHTEKLNLPSVTMATAVCAVAAARAIEAVVGEDAGKAGIKWVNDIFVNGKKVCGILTEGITDFESGSVEWIVAGIGINVRADGIPHELRQVAGGICCDNRGAVRNRLAAELINTLLYSDIWRSLDATRQEYRDRLIILGKRIAVIGSEEEYEAVAIDIDQMCRLVVQLPDGNAVTLSSGEVSIRPEE